MRKFENSTGVLVLPTYLRISCAFKRYQRTISSCFCLQHAKVSHSAEIFVLPNLRCSSFKTLRFCYCVCVCVRARARASFPSILVTVPSIKARRALRFAAYSGDYTLQRILFVPLQRPGSHRRGRTLGLLVFFFVFSLMPHLLLRCVPRFFIARRVQPSLPSLR